MPSTLFAISTTLLAAIGVLAGCESGDSKKLRCYNGPEDTDQMVHSYHIYRASEYLREYGLGARKQEDAYWTMTAKDTPDCAEWTVYKFETALVLAKHIGTNDSKVLYTDIARTLDDEDDDEVDSIKNTCDGDVYNSGGSYGVQFNPSDPAYHTDDFTKGTFSPEGIIIKVVRNPDHKKEEL